MPRPVVAIVYGTRPEAIKLGPVVEAARLLGKLHIVSVCTGQHRELLRNAEVVLSSPPDTELDLMRPGQAPSEFIARATERLDRVLADLAPVMVLTQGDTATAFAATLCAFHRRVPTGHVEAGLRTRNLSAPFPEEAYRQMIDRIATRLYAPTPAAARNLLAEGRAEAEVLTTGNTGVDAVMAIARSGLGRPQGKVPFVLATLHRREAFGEPLSRVCRALRRIAAEGVGVVLPVHPNPSVRAVAAEILDGQPGVWLVDPLPYPDLVQTMLRAVCVVTDSGGIQEEAPTLGVPVLITRETTERPEAVEAGAALLLGHDEERIFEEVLRLHRDPRYRAGMAVPRPLFGDGRAGERIAVDVARLVLGE